MSTPGALRRFPWTAPLASGILLLFAYEPFSIPLLPFVGLVPLFWFYSSPRTTRQVVVGGLAFSVPYFVGNLYWMFYLAGFTAAGLAGALVPMAIHCCSFALFAIGINVLNHSTRASLVWTAPVLWVLREQILAQGALTFPWVSLGYSLSDWPALIQHADLLGVYGLSWWLALVNALIVALWVQRRRRWVHVTALALALLVPPVYGLVRTARFERALTLAPTIDIVVVQPNIPQHLKWDRAARDANLARLDRLVTRAEAAGPQLVIAPEACLPMVTAVDDTRLPPEIPAGRCPLLLGVIRGIGEREGQRYREHYNSAVLAGPNRNKQGSYDKQYLVPVSEAIPYRKIFNIFLPFMRKTFGRIVPGPELDLLPLPGQAPDARFGTLICYESLFTSLARELASRDARMLVLLTNDAWFSRSTMPYQHVGQSVLRAVETRRSVVLAANTGISGWVDPLGRVRVQTPLFEEAVVRAAVPLISGQTFYVRWGDLIVYGCYLAALVLFVGAWRFHRRSR